MVNTKDLERVIFEKVIEPDVFDKCLKEFLASAEGDVYRKDLILVEPPN